MNCTSGDPDTDFLYANSIGCSVKLFGEATKVDGNIYASVAPVMINAENKELTDYAIARGASLTKVTNNSTNISKYYGNNDSEVPTIEIKDYKVPDFSNKKLDNVKMQNELYSYLDS